MNNLNQPLHGPVYDLSKLGFERGAVAIVTGAGSGIGQATAITLAKSGLRVALWDLNSDGARETRRQIESAGGIALEIAADVGSDADVTRAIEESAPLGTCRHLVNNAGPAGGNPGTFYDNCMLAVGSVHRVTNAWIERFGADAQSVVNVASIAGNFIGSEREPFYPTAKAGIAGYTRFLAVKYKGRPRANAVAPGFTITPRTLPYLDGDATRGRVARIPVGRMGLPEDIAASICFLLSPAAGYINGVLLPVDGGVIVT